MEVGDGAKQNRDYFKAIIEQMKNGGREKLLSILMERDVSNIDWMGKPKTSSGDSQKMQSLDTDEKWMYDCITDSIDTQLIPWKDGYNNMVENKDMYSMYVQYMKIHKPSAHIKSARAVSRFVSKLTNKVATKKNSKTYRIFPDNMEELFIEYFDVSDSVFEEEI